MKVSIILFLGEMSMLHVLLGKYSWQGFTKKKKVQLARCSLAGIGPKKETKKEFYHT